MGDNLIHDSLVYLVLCNMRQCQRPAEWIAMVYHVWLMYIYWW